MYNNFANVYDDLMSDVNYAEWTNYLCNLFDKFDRRPKILLDLACGTGGFSQEFAKKCLINSKDYIPFTII